MVADKAKNGYGGKHLRDKVAVGVLALQGDFAEHIKVLRRLDVDVYEVRQVYQLERLDGLIIPGGESTTISKLIDLYKFREAILEFAARKAVIWGTCAGLILMAKRLTDPYPMPLGILDVTVSRNWFGRQSDSFEADLEILDMGASPFRGVFIRAPIIQEVGKDVKIIAALPNGHPVAVKSGNLLGTVFHPELVEDDRFHRMFLKMATQTIPLNASV